MPREKKHNNEMELVSNAIYMYEYHIFSVLWSKQTQGDDLESFLIFTFDL